VGEGTGPVQRLSPEGGQKKQEKTAQQDPGYEFHSILLKM
jgi:hypothetical protein